MNFYFPDHRALCAAENTSHTLHNILTIRGALVRDARAWARLPDRDDRPAGATTSRWCSRSHHWPTWGRERAVEFLAMQRDMYLYLHDQTLRMINQGYVGAEIAELLEMPPGARGGLAHPRLLRVGQPQREGDLPALPRLVRRQPGPPLAAPAGGGGPALRRRHGRRRGRARRRAGPPMRRATTAGSSRCSTTSSSPTRSSAEARRLQAAAFEQLGFGAECGTWRNAFLAAATELRQGQLRHPRERRVAGDPGGAVGEPGVRRRWPCASTGRARGTSGWCSRG